MILLQRIAGVVLIAIAMLGTAGSFDHGPNWTILPIFLVMLAAGVWLLVNAQQKVRRAMQVAMNQRLLALGRETGTLTVAQVISRLALTSEEASAALTRLSHDGLATFDIDAEGAPVYRMSK